MKHNLDPFENYSTQELCDVLINVSLCQNVKAAEKFLELNIGPSANTGLSTGEQQLLSIARALLRRKSRIVVMDEPTANIDMRTDERVQSVIRNAFSNSTLITIAHRLNTIIDFDKIIVLDKGRVVEIGAPNALLQDKQSFLFHMVKAMGKEAAETLRTKAKAASSKNQGKGYHESCVVGRDAITDSKVEVVVQS